ncbi:MAG: hypothetical protein HYX71_05995 [Opitutae bacterium]|nr:hypothetical protein [Opitutae bacterium]
MGFWRGPPWCVTIDFETIEKPGDTFTLRERDTMAQRRIAHAARVRRRGVLAQSDQRASR